MANSNRTLQLTLKVVVAASQELQRLRNELQGLAGVPLGGVSDGLKGIGDQASKTVPGVDGLGKGLTGLAAAAGPLAAIAIGFGVISTAIQTAIGLSQQFYGSTIGAAEALNAQLLSSQTNLASATRIFKDGIELTDPTEKINATRQSLEQAIATIQKETQSLVGVTSSQVNELFQITLQNAATLNNQAKGLDQSLNDPIKAATTLTKGWAASLKVIGVPLNQASQEINSILKGTVDQNSILAKNLNITNQQVNQWKAQGTLVTELNKRLETFTAGNAIAANSIDGIASNIQDYVELFLRDLGKPFLQPTIDALTVVFKLIDSNKDTIFAAIKTAGESSVAVVQQVFGTVIGIAQGFAQPFLNQFDQVKAGLEGLFGGLASGLTGFFAGLAPAIDGLTKSFAGIGEFVAGFISNYGPSLGSLFSTLANLIGASLGGAIAGLSAIFRGLIGVFDQIVNHPITAFVVNTLVQGVSLLGNGLAALIRNGVAGFEAIVNVVSFLLTPINELGKAIFGALVPAQGLFQAIAERIQAFTQFIAPITDQLGKLFQVLVVVGQTLLEVIGQKIVGAFQTLGAIAQAILSPVVGLFQAIGSAAATAGGFIQDIFLGAFSLIAESLGGLVGKVVSTLTGLVNNPAFQAIAKTIGVDIETLKKSVEELGNKSQESGQKQADAAKNAASGIEIQATALKNLGTSYQQLQEKAENAQRAIAEGGGGDSTRFANAAKELIEITKQQVELGQISQEEAAKRLQAIANDNRLEVDLQQKAQAEITRIREQGNKVELAQIEQQVKEVESAVKRREISEVEGSRRITALKKEQLAQQLADVQESIEAEMAAIAAGRGSGQRLEELKRQRDDLNRQAKDAAVQGANEVAKAETDAKKKQYDTQKAQLEAHLAEVEAARANGTISEEQAVTKITEIRKQQLEIQLKDILAQIEQAKAANDPTKVAQLEAQANKIRADISKQGAEGQKQIFDAKLKDFEAKEKKATDTVKLAEAERKAEIDKQVAAGTLTREQAESKKLELVKASIQKEIDAERKKIAVIQALQAKTPEAQKQKDEKLMESRKRLADLTSQLAQNEISQQDQLKQAAEKAQQEAKERAIAAIEAQARAVQNAYTAQIQPLQQQLSLLGAIAKALDNQKALLSAQKELQSSMASLVSSAYQVAADLTEDETEKKQIQLEAKEAELAAITQQFAIQRQMLALEIQRNALALEQEKIELRVAKLKADAAIAQKEANVKKLQAQGATKEEIEAARLDVEASKQERQALNLQDSLLAQKEQLNQKTGEVQLQSLDAQEKTANLGKRAEIAKLTDDKGDDELVRQEALAEARKTFQAMQKTDFTAVPPLGSIVPSPQSSEVAGGSMVAQFKEALTGLQLNQIAPQIAINNFYEGGKTGVVQDIGKQVFDTIAGVIKQAGKVPAQ